MVKKVKSLLFLFVMLSLVFQINAVEKRINFEVKKVEPSKVQLKKGGKEIQIKISGKNLGKIKGAVIGKFRGKKFRKSSIKTRIIIKKSSSRQLFIRLSAGTKVNPGENYILRLFGKKVNKDTPFLDVSTKILETAVVPLMQKIAVPLKAPLTTKKTLPSTTIPSTTKAPLPYKSKGNTLNIGNKPDLIVRKIRLVTVNSKTGSFECFATVQNIGKTEALFLRGWRLFSASHSGYFPNKWQGNVLKKNVMIPPKGIYEFKVMSYLDQGQHDKGTHTIKVKVDPNDKVNESNERNNGGSKSITILPSVIKSQVQQVVGTKKILATKQSRDLSSFMLKPDLIIENIIIEFDDTRYGSFTTFAKIKNIGTYNAFLGRGWPLFGVWTSGDYSFGLEPLENNLEISPGISVLHKAGSGNGLPGPGIYTIKLKVDTADKIDESNENNNFKSKTFTFAQLLEVETPPDQSLGDLTIESIYIEPSVATIEGDFEVVVKVKNIGAELIFDGYKDIIHCKNLEEVFGIIYTFNAGETKVFRRRPTRLEKGTFTWEVQIDHLNKVVETDETNNSKTFSITIN